MTKGIQIGHNPRFPEKILYWKFSKENIDVPKKVTDEFLISSVAENGKLNLVMYPEAKGAIKLVCPSQENSVIIPDGGYLIFSASGWSGLEEKIFNFIYRKDD